MKIVVGIDPSHSPENIVNLLRRLEFPEAEAVYASFASFPVVPTPGLVPVSGELTQELLNEQRDIACRAMKKAMEGLQDRIPGDETIFDFGDAAHQLEKKAEEHHADLIAIGSRPHSPLEAAFLGSVGRGLTLHATRSMLVAKGKVEREGPLKAVFAYDGSESCRQGLELLLGMRPAGLKRIDVLIVDTPDSDSSPIFPLFGNGILHKGPQHRHDVLLGVASSAAERLKDAGYEVRAICTHGPVEGAIREAVADLGADLVIMGAQGHGLLERVLLGSRALQQIVGEPYSVLILRPR